jgi:hypothetical protein
LTPLELRQRCHTFWSADRPRSAAEDFSAMAAWCESHQVAHDSYGEGALIQDFEKKIADLLGLEAGVFVITGTLTKRRRCAWRVKRAAAAWSHCIRRRTSCATSTAITNCSTTSRYCRWAICIGHGPSTI